MNADDKNRIVVLRKSGVGYKKIAQELGINENSVKSFCRRNGLAGSIEKPQETVFPGVIQKACKNCGTLFLQYPGHREKVFCCDACRNKWWNLHIGQANRKTMYEYTCPTCGKKFSAYGNRQRKYCSHACYIIARFGNSSCK